VISVIFELPFVAMRNGRAGVASGDRRSTIERELVKGECERKEVAKVDQSQRLFCCAFVNINNRKISRLDQPTPQAFAGKGLLD